MRLNPRGYAGYQIFAYDRSSTAFVVWVRTPLGGGYGPDVIVSINPCLLDSAGDKQAVHVVRSWLRHSLFPDLPFDRLVDIERITYVDLKTDVVVAAGSGFDLRPDTRNRVLSAFKHIRHFGGTEDRAYTGFMIGPPPRSERDGRRRQHIRRSALRVYDKGAELAQQGDLGEYLYRWHSSGIASDGNGGVLWQGLEGRIWRIECQYGRDFLRSRNIKSYEDLEESAASLVGSSFSKVVIANDITPEMIGKRIFTGIDAVPIWDLLKRENTEEIMIEQIANKSLGVTLTVGDGDIQNWQLPLGIHNSNASGYTGKSFEDIEQDQGETLRAYYRDIHESLQEQGFAPSILTGKLRRAEDISTRFIGPPAY
jgi:hypothetical protein